MADDNIMGHGDLATHDTYALIASIIVKIEDRDIPFVEWVNEAGMTVEAVFCGHTHENHIFYDVATINIDGPPDYSNPSDINYVSPYDDISLQYSSGAFYIETDTAIAHYEHS